MPDLDAIHLKVHNRIQERKPQGKGVQRYHFFWILIVILGWIAPPVAILVRFGICVDFFVNIVLTLMGYIPGHVHNYYCQNIRNNYGRNRTPKWVLKAGLVRPQDPRGGKHKWAGRYDERLPDSARTGYSDGPEGYEGNGTGDWDGRGPEPSRHKGRRDFLTPWNDEVDLGEEQNGNGAGDEYRLSRPQSRTGEFDPLENEAFYSSGGAANISDSEARKRRHKQKGPKGAFHKHKDRYLNPDKSTAPDRFGTMDAARRSSSRREDEYQDDFERNLNQEAVAAKRKPAAEPEGPEDPWAIKPQPTGNGSSEPEQQQQQKRSEDFLNHTF